MSLSPESAFSPDLDERGGHMSLLPTRGALSRAEDGRTVAAVVAGAWRSAPAESNGPMAALARVAPFLLQSGTGALAWWRTSHAGRHRTGPALLFQEAYRLHNRQAQEHLHHLSELLGLLRSVNV